MKQRLAAGCLAVWVLASTAVVLADSGSADTSSDVFFAKGFKPADLYNGHVLQSSPYVVVQLADTGDSSLVSYASVLEYVGQYRDPNSGVVTVWKEEEVDRSTGVIASVVPALTMYPVSLFPALSPPSDGQGIDFGEASESGGAPIQNTAWAVVNGSSVTPVDDWDPRVPNNPSGFLDVPVKNPYSPYITDLHNKGKIDGYGNGYFGPGDILLRAQFVKMFAAALGVPASAAPVPWKDVPDWALPYAQAVYAAHAIHGYSDTEFGSNDPITREQAAAIVWRWLSAKGVQPASGYDWATRDVSDEFKEDVRNVLSYHLHGPQEIDDQGYHPKRAMNRAEAAALFDLAMQRETQTLQQAKQGK